ncbi:TetR/AcrR family transcriptional regulator [Sediminibacillus albus]|uniref:TetR/AcrR family transcriptional regulator n=1 Tax=Sediminibacillus albus TaxID=407036 RepID=UPI001588122D|nr:TetR/AcrR family transcriptional regulator [Sediminibacillus albus]
MKEISKKQELKDIAVTLFAEKGYHLTSVQEIAKACGVSKGAFYKHFESKESLLIELVKDNHQAMFQKAQSVPQSDALPAKQVLQQRITIELKQMKQNSSIFLLLFKEFPLNEKNAVSFMMEDFRLKLLKWHKQSLREVFGESVLPNIWDVVILYEGMMKEFLSLIIFHRKELPVNRLAELIASSLEAIIHSSEKLEPVLTEDSLCGPLNQEEKMLENKMQQQLVDVENKLHTLSLKVNEKKKLVSSLNHLKEECKQEQPKLYLIEALLQYMKTKEGWHQEIVQLEETITRLFREKGED